MRSDIQTDRRVRQEFAPGAAGDVGGVPSSEVNILRFLNTNHVKVLTEILAKLLNNFSLFRSEE